MMQIQNKPIGVQSVKAATTPGGISETELEKTVGVALLSDINTQLGNVAQTMKSNLNDRQALQSSLTGLQLISAKDSTSINGTDYIELTADEYKNFQKENPGANLKEIDGKFYVARGSVNAIVQAKQEELAGLNTSGEMISLQVQSLVDQRSQSLAMLTNLMSSRHSSMMAIINNLK